jgi:hypothetical protein
VRYLEYSKKEGAEEWRGKCMYMVYGHRETAKLVYSSLSISHRISREYREQGVTHLPRSYMCFVKVVALLSFNEDFPLWREPDRLVGKVSDTADICF